VVSLWHTDITITHEDPKVLRRLVRAFNKGRLFDEFIPCPYNLQEPRQKDWFEWLWINWGTEVDVGRPQGDRLNVVNNKRLKFALETTIGPPIPLLDHWVDMGCHVRAKYSEPECMECGVYKDKMISGEKTRNWVNGPSSRRRFATEYLVGVLRCLFAEISGGPTAASQCRRDLQALSERCPT
jgi:hypothetical protein